MSAPEQYLAGFEAWARENGHPIRFNADGSYAGMNSYRFEGYAGARREAGAEPSRDLNALSEMDIALLYPESGVQQASDVAAGALPDEAGSDHA